MVTKAEAEKMVEAEMEEDNSIDEGTYNRAVDYILEEVDVMEVYYKIRVEDIMAGRVRVCSDRG